MPTAVEQVGNHAMLILAGTALLVAGYRAASALGANGLERVVAMSVFAVAAAVLEALTLGLIGLGTNPFALTIAAIATYVGTLRMESGGRSPLAELSSWWHGAGVWRQVLAGIWAGVILAWIAWSLYRPDIGIDGIYYHLPEALAWVHGGSPGSIEPIHPWYEVGNYPLNQEILVAWGIGISQSLIWQSVLGLLLIPVAFAAGLVGLKHLGIPEWMRVLAMVSLLSVPVLAYQADGPAADLPALCWLVCAAGLGVAATDRPKLLAPALIAAGLAVGTKTTALPLASLLVALLLVNNRRSLRDHRSLLLGAIGIASVLGLTWYVRDLINHGSPFWPFAAAPWGDPVPELLDSYTSFFADPSAPLEGNASGYLTLFAGAFVLIAGSIASPLWAWRKEVIAGSALTVASVLLWSTAPTTGVSTYEVLSASVSQVRYLMPVVALSILTLALSTRGGGVSSLIAVAFFVGAAGWNLGQLLLDDSLIPFSRPWGLIGAVVGGGAVLAWQLVHAHSQEVRMKRKARRAAFPLAVLLGAVALAATASGYTARYSAQMTYFDSGVVAYFAHPARRNDDRPIHMAPEIFGMLTGDDLRRTVSLIDLDTECEEVSKINESSWVIMRDDPLFRRTIGYTAAGCLTDVQPAAEIGGYRIYEPAG